DGRNRSGGAERAGGTTGAGRLGAKHDRRGGGRRAQVPGSKGPQGGPVQERIALERSLHFLTLPGVLKCWLLRPARGLFELRLVRSGRILLGITFVAWFSAGTET